MTASIISRPHIRPHTRPKTSAGPSISALPPSTQPNGATCTIHLVGGSGEIPISSFTASQGDNLRLVLLQNQVWKSTLAMLICHTQFECLSLSVIVMWTWFFKFHAYFVPLFHSPHSGHWTPKLVWWGRYMWNMHRGGKLTRLRWKYPCNAFFITEDYLCAYKTGMEIALHLTERRRFKHIHWFIDLL